MKDKEDLKDKKPKAQESQSSVSGSGSEESEQDDDNGYDSSFVNDDVSQQEDLYRGPPPAYLNRDDYKLQKKKKKKQMKQSAIKSKSFSSKIRHHNDEQDEMDEGDLLLLEDQQNKHKKLKRLKRNQQAGQDDIQDQGIQKQNWQGDNQDQDIQNDFQGYNKYNQEESEESSLINEIIDDQKNIQDIFQPGDLVDYYIEPHDKQIVDFDIPERQFMQLKNHAKISGKSIQLTIKQFQSDDKSAQSRWIYQKLRSSGYLQTYDDRSCKDKIYNVLQLIHKQHLQIMYIYYYRKKLFSDVLNLQILWKIQQLDDQWSSFKQQHQKLKNQLVTVLKSIQQIPKGLQDMLNHCNDVRILRYFKQYEDFVYSKLNYQYTEKKKRSHKASLISQIRQKGVSEWLKNSQIFLSPQNLCINLRQRMQQKKPRTPYINPKQQLDRFFKNNSSQNDAIRFPLLTQKTRIQTICKYLQLQLFNYPQLRKILKDKYYKKLVIQTNPTKKGQQDINLYSIYFPVKRIRQKPISTLKRQIWILATEAQRLGFIKIDLKFQWQLTAGQLKNFEGDIIYLQLAKYYFDINAHQQGDIWNMFRKQVLTKMLQNYFFPNFIKQIRDDLTRQGHKQIINIACQKFRQQLNKGPSTIQGKPIKILAMVLQNQKLGMAFVDQVGQAQSSAPITLCNDQDLKRFVNDQMLYNYIQDHKPDQIVIAANCRRAQTLRKQLRTPNLFQQSIYCSYGEYEVSSLVAKKRIIKGVTEERAVLEAISMARMKQNPMAEILSLWSQKIDENGVLEMNFHPLQKTIDPRKLKDALQKVAIQVVNLVGIDLNLVKKCSHYQNQIQFICGLGPRKAFQFIERLKFQGQVFKRRQILEFVSGQIVYKNCSSFFKIQTQAHKVMLEKDVSKDKKKSKVKQQQLNLLDMTRIPDQWYKLTQKIVVQAVGTINLIAMKQIKNPISTKDQVIALIECFKHPDKLRNIQCDKRSQEYLSIYFDEELVKSEIMNKFKNPRQPERAMEIKDTFYNLLRQTPQTLKRYMIFTVKIVSLSSQYLNVVISQNGLFGYIKIYETKKQYQKGNYIKALIIGFPFDQKKPKDKNSQNEQQLLKVQMALNFPHKSQDRSHDCFVSCFPSIVKEIHPQIDLDKDRFQLKKQDRPIIEVKEENTRVKAQYRRISHPKYKNVTSASATQIVKSQSIGDFLIRPSSQGPDYLAITWHFYKGVVAHIKIKSEIKGISNANIVYRIIDRDRDKIFSTLDQIIQKCIKPMNGLVQDVISNKKFLAMSIEQIQQKVKTDMGRDNSHIHYFFGCHEDYPQFFILVYIYKDKKPVKQLVKVRSSGLYFHQQQFQNIRDLIVWFKEHFKQKQYQRYAKNTVLKR